MRRRRANVSVVVAIVDDVTFAIKGALVGDHGRVVKELGSIARARVHCRHHGITCHLRICHNYESEKHCEEGRDREEGRRHDEVFPATRLSEKRKELEERRANVGFLD